VGEHEAQDLGRVQVLGDLDRARLRHTDALRVGPPHRQGADAVSFSQARAARAELFDDADELVARRERRLRSAGDVGAEAPALSRGVLPVCKDDAREARATPARSAGYTRTEALSLASETRLPRASSLPTQPAVPVSVGLARELTEDS
jgi:hypothetical protein